MTDAPPPWRMPEVLGLLWSEVDLPRRTGRLTDTKTGALLTHSITSRYRRRRVAGRSQCRS
jgi:hypothetical protein